MASKCGSCQIKKIRMDATAALTQHENALNELRAQMWDMERENAGNDDALREINAAIDEAQTLYNEQVDNNSSNEFDLLTKLPDLFDGKPLRQPVHRPRSRLESILRHEVHADDVIDDELPRWRWSAEFDSVDHEEDRYSITYRGYDEEEQWSTYDGDGNGYTDNAVGDELHSTDAYWNAGGWTPYAEAPDLDDVYRTRSFLSPVQEMPDESELGVNLSMIEEEAVDTSIDDSLACESSAPTTAPSSPDTCCKPAVIDPLSFHSQVEDIASTLHVPTGLVPPLKLLPAFSFENLTAAAHKPAPSAQSPSSDSISSKHDDTSSTSSTASDKPGKSSNFWTRHLEH